MVTQHCFLRLVAICFHSAIILSTTEANQCGTGFYRVPNMTCVDDNECDGSQDSSNARCGVNTECYNTVGSFYCTCKKGYSNQAGKANFTTMTNCHELNECYQKPPVCGQNAHCYNTLGSFYCLCVKGFITSSGITNFTDGNAGCIDINECETNPCGLNAICTNKFGSFECTCDDGFVSTTGEHIFTNKTKTQCQEINECLRPLEACGHNASCKNTMGSFNCTCHRGFVATNGRHTFTNKTETQCQDVNECLDAEKACGPHSSCTNTEGYFFCTCEEGFVSTNGEPSYIDKMETRCQDLALLVPSASSLENISQFADLSFASLSKFQQRNSTEYHKLISNFLVVMEKYTIQAARNLQHEQRKNDSTSNFEVVMQAIRNNTIPKDGRVKLATAKNSMVIGWNTVAGKKSFDVAAAALISYKQLDSLMATSLSGDGSKETELDLISEVVTAAVTNTDTKNLDEPVNLTFENKKYHNGTVKCVSWDNTTYTWSAYGCKVNSTNRTYTVCSCTHLSSFAVLMALHEIKESDSYNLHLITTVGIILSLICLFVSILTFILCRSIRSIRTTIHTHLCVSLFLAEFLFLIGISWTANKTGCALVAGFLHYLFLACFAWMLLEGVQLYLMVVKVFNAKSLRSKYMLLFGYGFPLLVVGISAVAYSRGYGTDKYCWLDLTSGFVWAFLTPVCIIILVNAGFFIITVWRLVDKFASLNPDMNELKKIRAFTFTAIAQLCLLGCTWVFGMLHFQEGTIAMAYIFTIVNSLQGAFIFILHCLFNKQVRDEYIKFFISVCHMQKASKYSEFSTSSTQGLKSTRETGM
ncbi:adhesion G protein-coupled receptor E1 isoform X2 [Scyliorhinus canicula]|uniref:adhesion G protein-coupled receptor E1 isoform X2 n=1 Tax=Scyliorhinus canicula TaxID=7830 RepID=UPI0018F33EF7|nr:adhesion G protein-coupled receptor E1 isoform X2 [Scyliorhinus canicula]